VFALGFAKQRKENGSQTKTSHLLAQQSEPENEITQQIMAKTTQRGCESAANPDLDSHIMHNNNEISSRN
jgi:hypothetical protein